MSSGEMTELVCYWEMQLQIARRLIMVCSRWQGVVTGVFDHTNDVIGSKLAHEMLCFTIERLWSDTKVGSAGRRLRAMSALAAARSAL